MMHMFVTSRLLGKKRKCITYGPMEERDKSSLNTKKFNDDTTCTKMLRLKRESFFGLCQILQERSLLCDTVHVCMYFVNN
jgi:hypothetical protein